MDFELTPAQQALRARARELADGVFRERAARWDAEEAYPWDNVKDLVRAGLMGITIPKAYGGPGGTVLDVLLVVEEIARACGVTARIVVEGSLGVVGALTAYGTEAQKRRYFPWVLEDGEKPAIAITEPEAGSAATDLVTRADEAPEGWTLGGEKRWITGAGTSRLYLVYCRMGDRPGA
ncbi:MAG TPA: acyl-CoA dehydrogenase family protein, partial [Pseudomonadales bacterium]|nr:acyl-CoA dehydrogenase family protein [Pseudomonadales bacterium]